MSDGRRDLEEIWSAVAPARGRANELRRIFDHSLMPMVLVDNDRNHLDANAASRLFFRTPLAAMRRMRIDDLTPQGELPTLETQWTTLVVEGEAGGDHVAQMPDGPRVTIAFQGATNMLPGAHLIIFTPALWPEDELEGPGEGEPAEPESPLSDREREVLVHVATGCEIDQIARELVLSPNTVKTHLRNALRRLGARNRAHAVAIAMRRGDLAQN